MTRALLDGLRAALLARHAQHVVLVHFPIALFISGVAFDLAGQWTKRRILRKAATLNLAAAAWSALPACVSGLLAWQLQLEGQKLRGILLLHLILAGVSIVILWLVLWMHLRAKGEVSPNFRLATELSGVFVIALVGHLGGILSGVNGPN